MEGIGRLQFSDLFFTELPVPPQAAGVSHFLDNTVIHGVGSMHCNISSSSVYSPFSDRVGLPPHNTPFPEVIIKSIGAACFTTGCPS